MSKLKENNGFCKYCKQAVLIQAPDDATQEELNEIATKECSCKEADYQRKREMKVDAASAYIENLFHDKEQLCEGMKLTVRAIFDGQAGAASYKVGKYTYKIDIDNDDCIRIKKTFRDEEEETF